jgi:hypothetical protein
MMINLVKKELPIFTLVDTYMNDEHNACPMIFWDVRTESQQSQWIKKKVPISKKNPEVTL